MSISLNDISYSKIENESSIVKNAMDIIGQNNNNYNSKINTNKPINPDDIVLPKNKNIQNKSKHKIAENKDSIDEQIDKIMIGDISNMSDISDNNLENKDDITLGAIFGNKTNNNININETNNKNEKNEFTEKEMDEFFGKNSQNKILDISAIQSFSIENEAALFDFQSSIFNKNTGQASNKISEPTVNNTLSDKKMTIDELVPSNISSTINDKSFASLKSNETLGIDFTQFMEENGMLSEVKPKVPPSQDLSILQEINSQHDNMRCIITKRYNGLKIVTERWKNSDIPSTINALQILKDNSVVKDFFDYAIISREDINLIPLTLDSAVTILPYVYILMKSETDVYWKTACRAGMTFLKIFMEKIEKTKINKRNASPLNIDPILEERVKKCDELIKIFKKIYESSYLKKRIKEGDSENNSLAYAFFSDLQFFLKAFDDTGKIVISKE